MGLEQIGKSISDVASKTNEVVKNTAKDIDKRIDVSSKTKEISTIGDDKSDIDKRIDISKSSNKSKMDTFSGKIDKNKEYIDRINQAKTSKGKWDGQIGESTLKLQNGEKVEYKNGYPNFNKYSKGDVTIKNMTSDKDKNWAIAKKAYAEKWNKEHKDGKSNWTEKDVAKYKKDNNLEFHECEDMKTCQLVPDYIHKNAQHYGGRHECKIRGK